MHKVCRKQKQTLVNLKQHSKQFPNGIKIWVKSTKVFLENGGSWLTMKDGDLKVLNLRRGRSNRWRVNRCKGRRVKRLWLDPEGQSSRCLREPTRERWERRASEGPWMSRQLWHTYVSGTWLLRILAHDRWIQVLHLLHSIMARPAKGFMQKHVTRSHESSSEKTGYSQRLL